MSWDGLARWYRWLEYAAFGRALERCRFAYLDEVSDACRVIVLGDGDGRFLVRLACAAPEARIESIDFSAGMLALAGRRVQSAGVAERVRFHQLDLCEQELPNSEYDLVVTHFFLDCFDRPALQKVSAEIAAVTTGDARWLVSEFRKPAGGVWGVFGAVLISGMYLAFGGMTGLRTRELPDYAAALHANGFEIEKEREYLRGLAVAQVWKRVNQ